MENKKRFRVLIAGAGIAGLALANMLQKHGIDFLVLEAFPDIAPQVGASIGFQPQGLRILDQLGMYQDLRKQACAVNLFEVRNDKGEVVVSSPDAEHSFIQRHGYPLMFFERQLALKIFHSHLDKSKVLAGKAICDVELLHDGVSVTTTDGNVYSGDILVGCDGIHSKVRQEMVRLANELSPGYFPAREFDNMPCDYGCVFGISKMSPRVHPGLFAGVIRYKNIYGIVSGLDGRVYWFHFFTLQKRAYGADIPRFTKDDEARHIREHENDAIGPNLKLRDLIAGSIAYNMTALPEYTFQQWHYNRILTIGDSAHKFHPIAGHGGTAALETGVALTNFLAQALKESPSNALTHSQVTDVFQKVQDSRRETVKALIAASHPKRRIESLGILFHKFTVLYILPRVPFERAINNHAKFVPQALRLENISLPRLPTLIPYDSELLNIPFNRGWRGWALALLFLALSGAGFRAMDIWAMGVGASSIFENVNVTRFTGIEIFDKTLSNFPPQYKAGNKTLSPGHCALQLYFLISLFPVIAIYTIESVRKRNSFNLLTFTSFWAIYQVLGIAVVGPIYYAAYVLSSSNMKYWWPVFRQVPTSYAKTLLPALLLGYLLPTILLFQEYPNHRLAEAMIIIWLPAPIYVNILLKLFSTIYAKVYPDSPRTPPASKPMPDIPSLKVVYVSSFSVAALIHIFTLSVVLSPRYPDLSLAKIFVPHFISGYLQFSSESEGIRALWLANFWVFWIATMVWCVLAVWDMNRIGRARVSLRVAVVIIVLGVVALGPGATIATVWYWREEKMAKVSFKTDGPPTNLKSTTEGNPGAR
ncbi:hypothetical protein ACJ72_06119 [Emergomyces africanus]|uniref:FAD-binding domain-containing protein n=1 Tax=Emergomyces africanus TaxID=1955775 RepID=A0A1B7NS27_9EURO|nr:hypothetical protein ACJ72_06119 [Emergomyces africanus]